MGERWHTGKRHPNQFPYTGKLCKVGIAVSLNPIDRGITVSLGLARRRDTAMAAVELLTDFAGFTHGSLPLL